MAIKELTNQNFESEIKNGVSLVDFWAPWCGACRMMMPVFEQFAGRINNINMYKFNISEEEQIPTRFNISAIPTFILFNDGKEIERIVGHTNVKALTDLVRPYM